MRILVLLTLLLALAGCSPSGEIPQIIFDTDIGGDADDLGALAMLHNLDDRGECKLRAVMCWSTESSAVPAIDAVNRWYGHPDIPIGLRKEGSYAAEWMYTGVLAREFEYVKDADSVPDATSLYRKILAGSPDHSITLVTVGPLKNIKNLINSGPDGYSNLDGLELMELKIKEMVVMGGKFPEGDNEWNFNGNMPGVTRFVLEQLRLPITFAGFELGVSIKTGAALNEKDPNTPLYLGFRHFSEHAPWIKDQFKGEILDNASYDQTAVLWAVRGEHGGLWERRAGGYCVADERGGNRWVEGGDLDHGYLVLKKDAGEVSRIIESLMLEKQ